MIALSMVTQSQTYPPNTQLCDTQALRVTATRVSKQAGPGLRMILICSMAVGPVPDCCVAVMQLSQTEALEGLVAPASAFVLLGQAGPVLIIIICFMAVTSSGASEMVAISSLFTFDVYRRYINPKVPPAVPHLKFKESDACTTWSCLEGIT